MLWAGRFWPSGREEEVIKKQISGNVKKPVPELETGIRPGNAELVYNKASENLIEITFAFASLQAECKKLCDIDSITWKQMFVDWSNGFETIHSGTDWDQNDYLAEIEKYARQKILEYAGIEK